MVCVFVLRMWGGFAFTQVRIVGDLGQKCKEGKTHQVQVLIETNRKPYVQMRISLGNV